MSFSSFHFALKAASFFFMLSGRLRSGLACPSASSAKPLTVLKLVSMPPNQRWSTKGTPARAAFSDDVASLALGADHQDSAAVGDSCCTNLAPLRTQAASFRG